MQTVNDIRKKFRDDNNYCHNVKRRDEGHMLRRMLNASLPGKRRRGRLKTRWIDSRKRDMESVELKEEDVLDWITCKNDI